MAVVGPLNESQSEKVKLDGQEITVKQFNETLQNLEKNQRIVESAPHTFHIVERFYS